ncbi:MAG TPA: nucleotide exchange factor GrpE [Ramlibacter sp.]|nr:nucleotide exchange factor GrpE [Ramlibacter sp.]
MSDENKTEAPESAAQPPAPPNVTGFADASPEEIEAAQAANDADALAQAQSQLAALQAKNTELSEQVLRAQAEAQNTRRRADEEMSKARKFAVESFAESLLAVVDSLEAGLAHKDATPEQIREGAEVTLRQLKSTLERNKVVEINPAQGAKFDPHQHQAISVAPLPPGSTQEPNTVVSVLQKGYLIAERVLRPALVTVSAPK